MKQNVVGLMICAACMLFVSCNPTVEYEESFEYTIPVRINSGNVEFIDKVIELEIDLEDKLKDCYSAKRVDYRSIQVQEVDTLGNVLDDCLSQLDLGTLVWIMKGTTRKGSSRYYNIRFNSIDRKPINASILPENTAKIEKEDLPGKWAFSTPNGYFVFEEQGGAFGIFSPVKCEDDAHGKDWVRGDYKEYNGVLNIGDPNTKAIFHPNEDDEVMEGEWGGCKSDILISGPLKYRLRATNKFGELPNDYRSNTAYTMYYDIFPNFIRASVTRGNERGYVCVMEVTPGGDSLELTDYVMDASGKRHRKSEGYSEDVVNEWALIRDQQDSSGLFFIHAQDDSVNDGLNWYEFMQAVMVGWGRDANPAINDYSNQFYLGFANNCGHSEMETLVASLTSAPGITVGKTRKGMQDDWGRIDIEKVDGNFEVRLENTEIRCVLQPVMTANLETAITGLTVIESNTNVSGKHLDEMARRGGDRGTLSDGTRIVYEGKDKKIVHLEWDNGASVEEITLFRDKPYLKIDYLNMYINICDLGNKEVFKDGKFVIYGAESWKTLREKQLSSGVSIDTNAHHALTDALYPRYPNPLLGDWGIAAENNPMNYKGWYIMGVYSPANDVAYGRVVPANAVDHLKLLDNSGFEQFPYWFDKTSRGPFTEFLFAIPGGEEEILSMGKEIVEMANDTKWYEIDSVNRSVSNGLIEVGYGADKLVEGHRLTGLTLFYHEPSATNLAQTLDAYGYGYARYYIGGPSAYSVVHTDDDFVEVEVSMSMPMRAGKDRGVNVQKKERIFRDLPILEIEYAKLDLLWWEDFYTTKNIESRRYTIYGIEEEITQTMHESFRKEAEENCGHNFGDCYLRAAGSDEQRSTYKGYVIFGFYEPETGMGMGFVLPATTGLHNGFKLWSMYNYESFPFHRNEKKLPLKRWMFATSKGREGIMSMGKAIADLHSENKNISDNIDRLKDL